MLAALSPITDAEIFKEIENLKPKLSSGIDEISNKMIKCSVDFRFSSLFLDKKNSSLLPEHVSLKFKAAIIL